MVLTLVVLASATKQHALILTWLVFLVAPITRIQALNKKLDTLTEHNDIPKVSWTK